MAVVKVIQNHHSGGTMYKIGDKRDVADNIAAELKRNGLIETDLPAAPAEKVVSVLVKEKVVVTQKVEKVVKK